MTLDHILDALDAQRQRATYGAVGELLGRPARSVLQGRPRTARHSWIVRKSNGLPTGYGRHEQHPELEARPEILQSAAELRTWLELQA